MIKFIIRNQDMVALSIAMVGVGLLGAHHIFFG